MPGCFIHQVKGIYNIEVILKWGKNGLNAVNRKWAACKKIPVMLAA